MLCSSSAKMECVCCVPLCTQVSHTGSNTPLDGSQHLRAQPYRHASRVPGFCASCITRCIPGSESISRSSGFPNTRSTSGSCSWIIEPAAFDPPVLCAPSAAAAANPAAPPALPAPPAPPAPSACFASLAFLLSSFSPSCRDGGDGVAGSGKGGGCPRNTDGGRGGGWFMELVCWYLI
jgi:hypothetical protein